MDQLMKRRKQLYISPIIDHQRNADLILRDGPGDDIG